MKNIINSIFSSGIFVILIGITFSQCKSQKSENQGIMGKVTWLEGNQMPTIKSEKDSSITSVNPKGTPVKRTLKIYPLTNLMDVKEQNGLFTSIAGEAIVSIESDETGNYSIELSPGKYSIFTVEEGGLFANSFDGQGNIQPIQIKKGEWLKKDIVITYKAYF
ncbi:MAG: carboxypeptidase regulatory-like domain-containing protein [Algoriphagus sp.]|jgi:hypothetical protein|uniref:carboxypeptidase regulatory-like domain-containing protein n=1 Tax=Algoriphagus sp. TaxID=1872435 RepID=UPI002601FE5A|nr:carboxypeptidase regulatory-like domain-containing protein [Algoriphagus sp.]MDG1276303.1 carboxypeptidase regulatory-like domain-containing protein [Algoriphagus sp.]